MYIVGYLTLLYPCVCIWCAWAAGTRQVIITPAKGTANSPKRTTAITSMQVGAYRCRKSRNEMKLFAKFHVDIFAWLGACYTPRGWGSAYNGQTNCGILVVQQTVVVGATKSAKNCINNQMEYFTLSRRKYKKTFQLWRSWAPWYFCLQKEIEVNRPHIAQAEVHVDKRASFMRKALNIHLQKGLV